ncbi:MAG: DMT family transporter [Bacteroidota bacterium]
MADIGYPYDQNWTIMPFLGEFFALMTAALWSVSSVLFTEATRRIGSVRVNVTRLILGIFLLILVIWIWDIERDLTGTQVINLALSGLVGLAIGDSFLFKAFEQIGARLSMLILSSAPGIAGVAAYLFLGEGLPLLAVAGMILTIAGVSLVISERGAQAGHPRKIRWTGIVYAFVGAAGQGIGLIFAKLAFNEGDLSGFVAAFVRISGSLIFLFPAAVLAGKLQRPIATLNEERKAFFLTGVGSVVGPFLGISFSLIALANTKVGVAATLMATVPIIMLPLIRFVYKEILSWQAIVGAFVAVAGIAMLFLR